MPAGFRQLLVVAALVLGGCGGGTDDATAPAPPAPVTTPAVTSAAPSPATTTAPPATPTTTTAPATTPATPVPASRDCQAGGFTRRGGREGPCTYRGTDVYVADRGTEIPLREMKVRLNGFGVQPSDQGHVLAVFSLTVTNRLSHRAPFDVGSDQTALRIGSRSFLEDHTAESGPLASFVTHDAAIVPGGTQTGTVAFRIPRSLTGRLSRKGSLVVVQFSDVGSDHPRRRIAIIRTYR